jgi:peptidoglycan/xylan/chitin deacetylase (PgdA/CDA1 family)
MRGPCVLACVAAVVACGDHSAGRAPLPAPHVSISEHDQARWAPGPPRRSTIPVLGYHGIAPNATGEAVTPEQFARQMTLLSHAGYDTITLTTLVHFLRGEPTRLPPRPFLLTFDDGRLDSWTGSDATLRRLGFNAVLFVDTGRVDKRDPAYLSWRELDALERSGRWDVQLEAGTGKHLMRYGPSPSDVGSFYTYRGTDEILGGWRERVFGDLSWGEHQLAVRIHGYRPLAFSPPYGNYGQAGTNDPAIPRLLLARLHASFPVVFTQDRPALVNEGAGTAQPVGRLKITAHDGERDLIALFDWYR